MYSNINMGVGRESKHKCHKLASLWHTYYSRRSKIEGIWNFTKGLFLNEVTYSSFDEFPMPCSFVPQAAAQREFFGAQISTLSLIIEKMLIRYSGDKIQLCSGCSSEIYVPQHCNCNILRAGGSVWGNTS